MKTCSKRMGAGWVLALAACMNTAEALTYHVDFADGSDAGSGLSTNEAWKHCPGDLAATQAALAAAPGPGDVIRFKGGVPYRGTIHLKFNGGEQAPLLYDGNLDGAWGSGRAILDGENLNDNSRRYGFEVDTSVSDVAIRNFEIRRMGGVPDPHNYTTNTLPSSPGYGIYLRDALRVSIAGCLFRELGSWTNGPPNNTRTGLGGFGIYCFGAEDLTVGQCEFTRMEKGIRISPGQYGQLKHARRVLITGCNFHHYMRWLVELSTSAHNTELDDITVNHCRFHDFTEYDLGNWSGGWAYPHTDGIILGVSNYTNRNYGLVRLHSNCFFQDATTGGGTAMIFMTGMGGHVQMYNNVFVNVRHSLGAIYLQDGPKPGVDTALYAEIVNNTFHDQRYAVYLRSLTAGYELRHGRIEIRNNIFRKATTDAAFSVVVADTNSLPAILDHNCYFTPRADGQIAQVQDTAGKVYATLGVLRERWGWELGGRVADPQFQDISHGLGTQASRNDLRLAEGSPCIDAAIPVEGVEGDEPCTTPRPVANTSVGAYQTFKFSAPTNVRVLK